MRLPVATAWRSWLQVNFDMLTRSVTFEVAAMPGFRSFRNSTREQGESGLERCLVDTSDYESGQLWEGSLNLEKVP